MTAVKSKEYAQDLKYIYDAFRVVSKEDWKRFKSDKLIVEIKTESGVQTIEDRGFARSLRILGQLAGMCETFEEFQKLVEGKEVPPLKLSKEDLEVLKGGGAVLNMLTKAVMKTPVGAAIFASGRSEGLKMGLEMGKGLAQAGINLAHKAGYAAGVTKGVDQGLLLAHGVAIPSHQARAKAAWDAGYKLLEFTAKWSIPG